jgi:hypothetical protein
MVRSVCVGEHRSPLLSTRFRGFEVLHHLKAPYGIFAERPLSITNHESLALAYCQVGLSPSVKA